MVSPFLHILFLLYQCYEINKQKYTKTAQLLLHKGLCVQHKVYKL